MFAGVEQLRNGGTRPAATGRLCEWKEDPRWKYLELLMLLALRVEGRPEVAILGFTLVIAIILLHLKSWKTVGLLPA